MIFKSIVVITTTTLLLINKVIAYSPVAGHYGTYSIVPGFFKQDDPSTNATTFDYTDNLGLYNNYTWYEFENKIEELNFNSPNNIEYKVLFYARHAEGYHNAAETYYGTPDWNCYYSLIDGNGTHEWGPDAYLTETGILKAKNNSKLIKSLISKGLPLPQSFYSSPFTRAADTLVLTWYDLILKTGYSNPIFKESLRETIGLHTCDKHRNKLYLESRYPDFEFEKNFYNDDILWTKNEQEPNGGIYLRAKQFLDDIFTSDENTFISVTAHSGIGNAILKVINHRKFPLSTGSIIPLVIKRESVLGFIPPSNISNILIEPSSTAPSCTASIEKFPSSIAYSIMSVEEQSYTVLTVTTVISATPTN